MQVVLLLLVCLPVTVSDRDKRGLFNWFGNQVCYGDLGCFGSQRPFINTLGFLPKAPSDVVKNFTLYTLQNNLSGDVLDYTSKEGVNSSSWSLNSPIKIIIHGYVDSPDAWWLRSMKDGLLDKGDFNVIVVDWRNGADDLYQVSAANTRVVGAVIAKLLTLLNEVYNINMEDVHLIGHSLGAHISGYVGSTLDRIGRITGLDPAGPLFERFDKAVRLDPSDAIFVDVIHTNGLALPLGFGTRLPCGDTDFYPNGGSYQPDCPSVKTEIQWMLFGKFRAVFKSVICSHSYALRYFIESLKSHACSFTAYPCDSYENFTAGKCTSCGTTPCPIMGYNSALSVRHGKFYLKTNGTMPLCE